MADTYRSCHDAGCAHVHHLTLQHVCGIAIVRLLYLNRGARTGVPEAVDRVVVAHVVRVDYIAQRLRHLAAIATCSSMNVSDRRYVSCHDSGRKTQVVIARW